MFEKIKIYLLLNRIGREVKSMKTWYMSKSLWAAVIGIIAMVISLFTAGKITLSTEEQETLTTMIITVAGAIVPFISFIIIIIRKIIDLKKK